MTTEEEEGMGEAMKFATTMVDKIIDAVDESGETPADVYYFIWLSLGRILAGAGWTEEELVADFRFFKEQLD